MSSESPQGAVLGRAALYRRLAWASGLGSSVASAAPLSADEVRLGVAEGLGPLLGYRLRRGELSTERAADRDLLRHALLASVAQELGQTQALSEIATLFGAQGVVFVRLKAAALRGLVLPEGCRPATDLDLLVATEQFGAALEAMCSLGFVLASVPRRALTASRYHERTLARDNVAVDLHRGLSAWPLFSVASADLVEDAFPAVGGGLVPEPANLLVSLAVHVTQHGFGVPFRSLVDVLGVVQVLRPDPRKVVEVARRWRVRRGTSLLLSYLGQLGLSDSSWAGAAQELAGKWPVRRFVRHLPLPALRNPGAALRRERWWRARLVDQAWRAVAFYAYRGTLLVGDLALRGLPARFRDRVAVVGLGPVRRRGRSADGIEAAGSGEGGDDVSPERLKWRA